MELSKKKIVIPSVLIGLLFVLITVFSMYHVHHLGKAYFQFPLFLYGATILSLAVGGFVVYIFEKEINASQVIKVLSVLPPDERKVLKILFDRKEIEQNKLGTLSDLSSVKMSRVISTLEQRGIIEKKKQGYTNLIILKL